MDGPGGVHRPRANEGLGPDGPPGLLLFPSQNLGFEAGI